jgi:hypothetical protein
MCDWEDVNQQAEEVLHSLGFVRWKDNSMP